MEQINPIIPNLSQPTPIQKSPNQNLWGKYWEEFSSDQRKAFMRTIAQGLSHLISKQMRKMKEASQKLKESNER